jgi:hypothetical protein
MDHISGFFSRYLSPLLKQEQGREAIMNIIKEMFKVDISSSQISIRSGVCHVSGGQSLKHQIFLHQSTLLERIKVEVPTLKITSIV